MPAAKLNTTGQRWSSELCDYYAFIQDKASDFLSRSPIEATVHYQLLSTDEIKTILWPAKNQDDHKGIWVAALAVTKQPQTGSEEVFNYKCISSISKNQIQ